MILESDYDCCGTSRRASANSFVATASNGATTAYLAQMPPSTSSSLIPCRHGVAHCGELAQSEHTPAAAAESSPQKSGSAQQSRRAPITSESTRQDASAYGHHISTVPPPALMKLPRSAILLIATVLLGYIPLAHAKTQTIDWWPGSTTFPNDHRKITTKYARIQDSLVFRCPDSLSVSVYVVPADLARGCHLPAGPDREKGFVGYCRPNTSQPRMVLRSVNPMPNRPVFQEDQDYYFITTSNGTSDGIDNPEGGLCATRNMRLRVHVLSKSASLYKTDVVTDVEWATGGTASPRTDILRTRHVTSGQQPAALAPDLVNHPIRQKETASAEDHRRRNRLTDRDENPGFPAIVVLDESGYKRRIIVNSYQELTEKINEARLRNAPHRITLQVHPVPELPTHFPHGLDQQHMAEYEVFGTNVRSVEGHPVVTKPQSLEKRTRKPFDYEIGYEDENSSAGISPCTTVMGLAIALVMLLPQR